MIDDDLTLDEAATLLHKSRRWLQWQLREDREHAKRTGTKPKLQHHHRIGRTRLWTEGEFLALKAALITQEKEKEERERSGRRGSRSSNSTGIGGSVARCVFEDARNACDAVLNYQPDRNSKNTR